MAVIDVSFDNDEKFVGLPDLDCLQLEIGVIRETNEVILFDLQECCEIMRISNTEDHRHLLRSFAYAMDAMVSHHTDIAFNTGYEKGYRKRSLEIKWALENLLKVD